MVRHLLPIALFAGLAGGCYSDAGVGYNYGYPVGSDVYAAPGVDAVWGIDYPVFFSDGFYWRWDGGQWFRSPHRNHGWVYAPRSGVHPGYARYGMHGVAARPAPRGAFRGGFRGSFRGGGHRR